MYRSVDCERNATDIEAVGNSVTFYTTHCH